jgi:hypothetical protein
MLVSGSLDYIAERRSPAVATVDAPIKSGPARNRRGPRNLNGHLDRHVCRHCRRNQERCRGNADNEKVFHLPRKPPKNLDSTLEVKAHRESTLQGTDSQGRIQRGNGPARQFPCRVPQNPHPCAPGSSTAARPVRRVSASLIGRLGPGRFQTRSGLVLSPAMRPFASLRTRHRSSTRQGIYRDC